MENLYQKFCKATIELDHPNAEQIEDAFRELPRKGRLFIACDLAELTTVLATVERLGFFCIELQPVAKDRIRLSALKGKNGPCYETGRTATLLAPVTAVLDDDNHLIFGKIRVCEKTGSFYQIPPYSDLLDVSDADCDLLARLDDEPVAFDCDTFQQDAESLAQSFVPRDDDAAHEQPALYQGPFKLVILEDGAILRRGEPVLLSRPQIQKLRDSLLLLPPETQAVAPRSFAEVFAEHGPSCLLGEIPLGEVRTSSGELRLNTLHECSKQMHIRLLGMIDRDEDYFILVGSDPEDEFGCCPSESVGKAKRLVRAGILDAYESPAPADACTTTIFAFANEISVVNEKPVFTQNAALREKVRAELESIHRKKSGAGKTIVKTLLLAFLAISLGLAAVKAWRAASSDTTSATSALAMTQATIEDGFVLTFVQGPSRCSSCKQMQQAARNLVEKRGNPRLLYAEAELTPELLRRYRLINTSTILLIQVRDGREYDVVDLTEKVWQTIHDEDRFASMLERAVDKELDAASVAGD